MIEPHVFTIISTWKFLAIGIGFEMTRNNVLNISIMIPFWCLHIYCKKSNNNYWFGRDWA